MNTSVSKTVDLIFRVPSLSQDFPNSGFDSALCSARVHGVHCGYSVLIAFGEAAVSTGFLSNPLFPQLHSHNVLLTLPSISLLSPMLCQRKYLHCHSGRTMPAHLRRIQGTQMIDFPCAKPPFCGDLPSFPYRIMCAGRPLFLSV
jgi:hypothetical protein